MAYSPQDQDVSIVSGALVSSPFMIAGAVIVGLVAPAVTSCQAFLQASTTTVSADFKRVTNPAGSGDWTWALAAGDKAVAVHDVLGPFRHARIETSAAQTAPRTFKVIAKL